MKKRENWRSSEGNTYVASTLDQLLKDTHGLRDGPIPNHIYRSIHSQFLWKEEEREEEEKEEKEEERSREGKRDLIHKRRKRKKGKEVPRGAQGRL